MKVLVCGGRKYGNFQFLYKTLCQLQEREHFDVLVHGACSGADALASRWAGGRVVEVITYEAMWKVYGDAAGPIRNRQMAIQEKPSIVVAFPGGSGTGNMLMNAKKIQARIIRP